MDVSWPLDTLLIKRGYKPSDDHQVSLELVPLHQNWIPSVPGSHSFWPIMNMNQALYPTLYSPDFQLGDQFGFISIDAPVITANNDFYSQACAYPTHSPDAVLSFLALPPMYENQYFSEQPESPGSTPPLSPSATSSLSSSMVLPPRESSLNMVFPEDLSNLLTLDQTSYASPYVPRSDIPKFDAYFLDPRQKGRRQLLDSILRSDWYQTNQKEPEDTSRRSILCQFLERTEKGNSYICSFDHCGKAFDRQDRALGHIRMHLCHRPFPCDSQCGDFDCREKFFCGSYLQSHIKRPTDLCTKCNKRFHRQQMRRHSVTCTGYTGSQFTFPYPHLA